MDAKRQLLYHDELSAQKGLQYFKSILLSATIDEVTICQKLTLLSYRAANNLAAT